MSCALDPQLRAAAAHRAVEHVRRFQRRGGLALAVAAELERGGAADHLDLRLAQQRGDDLVGDAVGEIVHLRCVAFIVERQHGEHRFGLARALRAARRWPRA